MPIVSNGELLQTAENDGINVFLTGDQTLTHEQNLTGRTIAIVRCPPLNGTVTPKP